MVQHRYRPGSSPRLYTLLQESSGAGGSGGVVRITPQKFWRIGRQGEDDSERVGELIDLADALYHRLRVHRGDKVRDAVGELSPENLKGIKSKLVNARDASNAGEVGLENVLPYGLYIALGKYL